MLKRFRSFLIKAAVVALLCQLLTGCLLAAAGAGAAGGYLFDKHYKVVKKKSS